MTILIAILMAAFVFCGAQTANVQGSDLSDGNLFVGSGYPFDGAVYGSPHEEE